MKEAPYLGCRLRLRTRAQVRYEGQLYTIDPSHLTLSLANVRALDSPAASVYEYITFRASDVLDMTVLPPPEFDFNAANAKLQRPQSQPSEPAYVPRSSFYDHFSEGKATPRINAETFGQKQLRGSHRGRRHLPRQTQD